MEKSSDKKYNVILNSSQQINSVIINVLVELLIHEIGVIKILSFHNEKFNFNQMVRDMENNSENLGINSSIINQRVKLIHCKSIQTKDILVALSDVEKDTFVLLLGAERLFNSLKGEGIFVKQYSNMSFRSFRQEQLPWQEIVGNIHDIHIGLLEIIQKITFIITTEKSCFDKIKELFQAFEEPELLYIALENDTSVEMQNSIFKIITTSNLQEGLDFITKLKENLSPKLITYYYAKAYEFNGLRKEAIKMYSSIIDTLSSEEKVYLAELLMFDRRTEEAYIILEKIYEIDPWSKNLMKALIKASKIMGITVYEKWIEEAINKNLQDDYVLQEIGNFLMNNGRFSDACMIWRKLYNVTQNPYFEMMERYSYIYQKDVKREAAEEVLLDVARNYPQLQDEVSFRLGLVCLNKYDSPLKSMQYLMNLSNDSESRVAFEGALLRMIILQRPKFIRQSSWEN